MAEVREERRAGRVLVDAGAERALREQGTSLLPVGVVEVEGDFEAGDAVDVAAAGDGRRADRQGDLELLGRGAAAREGAEVGAGARGAAARERGGRAPRLLRAGLSPAARGPPTFVTRPVAEREERSSPVRRAACPLPVPRPVKRITVRTRSPASLTTSVWIRRSPNASIHPSRYARTCVATVVHARVRILGRDVPLDRRIEQLEIGVEIPAVEELLQLPQDLYVGGLHASRTPVTFSHGGADQDDRGGVRAGEGGLARACDARRGHEGRRAASRRARARGARRRDRRGERRRSGGRAAPPA